MSSQSSIAWYEIACWAFPVKVFTQGVVNDPLLRAVHSLRENFHMSDEEIQKHIGMPIGMIQSALNRITEETYSQDELERSEYQPPQDGWVFWCPATRELLPEIWSGPLQNTDARLKEGFIKQPHPAHIKRVVERLQHSAFVTLHTQCGEQRDILKLETRHAKPVKQILYVPVEFRGHDVICWKPQYCKKVLPNRALSKIEIFENLFLEREEYQTSKDDFDSKQKKLLLEDTEYTSIHDFDNDIRAWCVEQFGDLWQDGSSTLAQQIFSTRKQAQMDFYLNSGWQSRGQKWGTLLEWIMKSIGSVLSHYCDEKYKGQILQNLADVKPISSQYHKSFTKGEESGDLSIKDRLRGLRKNIQSDNCSIDGYSQIFCLALVTDQGLQYGRELNAEFPDFIKNVNSGRQNRNLCMHIKKDVCEIEVFIEQMVYVSKAALYFDQVIRPKMSEVHKEK